jgi:hypothetical protein
MKTQSSTTDPPVAYGNQDFGMGGPSNPAGDVFVYVFLAMLALAGLFVGGIIFMIWRRSRHPHPLQELEPSWEAETSAPTPQDPDWQRPADWWKGRS